MTSIARKTITAALATLTLGVTVLSSTAPASARGFYRSAGFYHHSGPGWGGAAALGIGALALGAIAASSAGAYGDCYIARRAVVDDFGNVVGYRRVRVCD